MSETVTCPLCGITRSANSGAYRWVRNQGRKLSDGYYQPRLSWDELHRLPFGESPVCTDRARCEDRWLARQTQAAEAEQEPA